MKRLLILIILFGFLACEKTEVQPEGASLGQGGDSGMREWQERLALIKKEAQERRDDEMMQRVEEFQRLAQKAKNFSKEYEKVRNRFTPNIDEAQILSFNVADLSSALQKSTEHCNSQLDRYKNTLMVSFRLGLLYLWGKSYSHAACSQQTNKLSV